MFYDFIELNVKIDQSLESRSKWGEEIAVSGSFKVNQVHVTACRKVHSESRDLIWTIQK